MTTLVINYKRNYNKILKNKKIKIIDMGPETEESVDYPEYTHKVCEKNKENNKGILICGRETV